jgi:hypothetical protein
MSKYENGYMGKIQYWTGKLNDEVMNTKLPNLENIDRIHRKLDYFIQRQWDLKNQPIFDSQQEFTAID